MQTSFQRALEMAEARAVQRRAESWRFWAGYEPDAVGACQSSTEAAALARVEVMARRAVRKSPTLPSPIAIGEGNRRRTPPLTPPHYMERGIGGIGMADIIAAWRVACAEHDARRTPPPAPSPLHGEGGRGGVVDRVIQWG